MSKPHNTNPNDGARPREYGESKGLTKRELFALEAMKCRLSNPAMFERFVAPFDDVARDAVGWADALIRRLNGEVPKGGSPIAIVENQSSEPDPNQMEFKTDDGNPIS
jgi:hypothetical protein